jgi:glutaminase
MAAAAAAPARGEQPPPGGKGLFVRSPSLRRQELLVHGSDAFHKSKRDTMHREEFVQHLESLGIRTTSGFVARELEQLTRSDGTVSIPRSRNHLFARALEGRLAIPAWSTFTEVVAAIAESVKRDVKGGTNADYIQVLRDADPSKFAVSVVTVDGQRFNYGDSACTFSMQSCSKPLTYAVAVDEAGGAAGLSFVHSHVGSEASGLAFNSISVNDAGVAHNPMVNAGAITVCSLVGRHCPDLSSRYAYLMSRYREIAGENEVGFSEATYLCEVETAWRNNAILYTLSEAGVFNKRTQPYATLDLYIQSCATEISTETAAMFAATFANGGVQPITGKRVLSVTSVKAALTLCFSCGLYDGSGTWAVTVGLPAKSGVAGLIYVVIPGVAGVAVFSPPLDRHGNSVRAVAFCERLVRAFPFGLFDKYVSDTLAEMAPPLDTRLLYLPPHLRRARAFLEKKRRRRNGRASSLSLGHFSSVATAVATSVVSSAESAMASGHFRDSDDSDDESAWAAHAVTRAASMGIDVDTGIDFSSAFRMAKRATSSEEAMAPLSVAPALLLSHSLSAASSSTELDHVDSLHTTRNLRRVFIRFSWRRLLSKIGHLWSSFQSLKQWVPGGHDIRKDPKFPAKSPLRSEGSPWKAKTTRRDMTQMDGNVNVVTTVRNTPPAAAVGRTKSTSRDEADLFLEVGSVGANEVESWKIASFLASKGMGYTRTRNPRVLSLVGAVTDHRGVVHFRDFVLTPELSADPLIWRALRNELVVANFEDVRHQIGEMASAAIKYVPPVAVRRDGTIPPEAIAAMVRQRQLEATDSASTVAVLGPASKGFYRREEAPDSLSAMPSMQLERSLSFETRVDLAEHQAQRHSRDPLSQLRETVEEVSLGVAGVSAALDPATTARSMSESAPSKMDEHRDAMDEELKAAARVTSDTFSAALCTCDGQYAFVGDYTKKVPIMEAVFPLLYAIAMEDSGAATVNAWAGTEPSSHPQDSFTLMDTSGGGHGG